MNIIKTLMLATVLFAMPLFAAEPVDINAADAKVLAERLDNVGPVKAERIVDYREQHGDFESIDELVSVRGIGLATLEDNRQAMTVGDGSPQGTQ